MNANELADHLEKYFDSEPYTSEVATMLRKQQEEILYWRSAFEKSMVLVEQIRHLEAQVYGGKK